MFLTEADAKAVFKRLELVCPEEKKDNNFFDNCSIIKKKKKRKWILHQPFMHTFSSSSVWHHAAEVTHT